MPNAVFKGFFRENARSTIFSQGFFSGRKKRLLNRNSKKPFFPEAFFPQKERLSQGFLCAA